MSDDVIERAKALLNPPLCTECGADHSSIMRTEIREMLADLVPELVAEIERQQDDMYTLGLSIHLGPYGEWGRQTLEMLFAELGIQPGDNLPTAVERVTGQPFNQAPEVTE